MTTQEFITRIKEIGAPDTSSDPDGWTPENPLWGHCAIVSLLAQEIFGGELVKASLKDHPQYSHIRSHIWNRIDGEDRDFTQDQYTDLSYTDLVAEVRVRDSILNHHDTIRRFSLIKIRFELIVEKAILSV